MSIREWLGALVSAAERHKAVAVASKILDWTGETIDFVGGATSFIGHAWQMDFKCTRDADLRGTAPALSLRRIGAATHGRPSWMQAGSTRTFSRISRMSISGGA